MSERGQGVDPERNVLKTREFHAQSRGAAVGDQQNGPSFGSVPR